METTLVTGANRGIGLEFCRQLAGRGHDVIAACRRSTPELDALGVRVESDVDVASDESVAALVRRLDGTPIDLLINNAGILERTPLENLDLESVLRQFEVNAVGTLRVTRALLGNLGEGATIAIITSLMGSCADNGSGGSYGYRMSKAAVNAAGVSLARDLASRGIAVAILHPGYVRTDMTGGGGNMGTDESVAGMLARLDALTLEESGGFWHARGERLPW